MVFGTRIGVVDDFAGGGFHSRLVGLDWLDWRFFGGEKGGLCRGKLGGLDGFFWHECGASRDFWGLERGFGGDAVERALVFAVFGSEVPVEHEFGDVFDRAPVFGICRGGLPRDDAALFCPLDEGLEPFRAVALVLGDFEVPGVGWGRHGGQELEEAAV